MNFIKFDQEKLAEVAKNGKPDDPIMMLNMLKFRDVVEEGIGIDGMSGEQAYLGVLGDLFDELQAKHPEYGGKPVFIARGGVTVLGTQDWDLIVIIQYKSREKFIEMIGSPDYKRISQVRAGSITDSRLIELSEFTG